MESLVARCVDAITRVTLGIDSNDATDDAAATTDAEIVALVERLELLPPTVGQCFAHRLQHYTLQFQRSSHRPREPLNLAATAERALWRALVDCQWLAQLRVAALPSWLQASPTDVDWATLSTLQELDVSRVKGPHSDGLVLFLLETLALDGLRVLNVSGLETVATDALFHTLATQCERIECLDMSYCPRVSDSAVGAVVARNHKTLRSLRLNGLRQLVGSDVLIDAIESCARLETLALADCVALTKFPDIFTKLMSVTALDVHGLVQFDDHVMRSALAGGFHRLQRLKLGESELSSESLAQLLRLSPSPTALVALDLSWCPHVSSDAIAALVRHSPSLTALTLRCTAIQDPALEAIGATLTNLRTLDLERCDDVSCHGFDRLVAASKAALSVSSSFHGGLRRLEELNLSWTSVTSAALVTLLSQCSHAIRNVRLQGCKGVDRSLLEFMSATDAGPWPQLQLVDFAWTNGASDELLALLAQKIPTATWIGYYGTEIG